MKIFMIWVQRKCSYPGQYAPELLEAIDEFSDEDNSGFINDVFTDHSNEKEFEAVRLIEAELDDEILKNILAPNKVALLNIRGIKHES